MLHIAQESEAFKRGAAIINALLIPLAAAAIYIAYLGATRQSTALLVAGITLTLASPFIAYLAARATLLRRLF
ncbi:hypothetical protein CF15_06100 [Pyrodictium occultum]|uniref:Uncharacterized protein n=1 Tax=Pyrodictium occultum TaxID=2309 RepID=A0A0V8RW64_PYROC|nr:hypothetical protein [Pyrodictium occultum]KSW12313.1 hypothetical protein CF15_06100 [Pyrodictium occultum]